MTKRETLKAEFQRAFGAPPQHLVRAPGRVNLIGEHTDYNLGFVLPMAIDRELLIAVRERQDREVRALALDMNRQQNRFSLDNITPNREHRWANYVRGVAFVLQARGLQLKGADLAITSEIPTGAGLSSSAALEVAVAMAMQSVSGFVLDKVALAQACQKAENEFAGLQSGIMDQFASALAREGNALLIDCRDLSYEYVTLPVGVSIVVADTMKKHALAASSGYNKRREESAEATRLLSALLGRPLTSLRDVSLTEFNRVEVLLSDIPRRRARHVLTENDRVLKAVAAARRNDVTELGSLMNASHESMKHDYEITVEEVDLMVDIARRQEACLGARMTGGGFGGSTVNLVHEANAQTFAENVAKEYASRTKIQPAVMIVQASAGADVVE